jgi:transcriptional regulator with XRE-family HTH domain
VTFKEKLEDLMRQRDLNGKAMERQGCGVSASTIRWWLDKEKPRYPDITQLEKIAKFFGVSVAYLADPTIESMERPREEVEVIEKCRELGFKRAGLLLDLALAIDDWKLVVARLIGKAVPGVGREVTGDEPDTA